MVYIKTFFDSSNLLRQKAYEEYNGTRAFSQYIKTKHGITKLQQLVERYFNAVGITVECTGIDVDLLVRDEITIILKDNDYTLHDYNAAGHIYFY